MTWKASFAWARIHLEDGEVIDEEKLRADVLADQLGRSQPSITS